MEMGHNSSETATATCSRRPIVVSLSSSGRCTTRPSCWRRVVTAARRRPLIGRRRSDDADEHRTPVTATTTSIRAFVERNDFYSQECNTHGK
uniref:Uncharacterized protein n=1 Tax=Leersia perrieri TaxID=77586 RepID=A0A0D9UZT1_9ORYZ